MFLVQLKFQSILQNALDRGEHEFVMDWACWYYEPDDPAFVKVPNCFDDFYNNSLVNCSSIIRS